MRVVIKCDRDILQKWSPVAIKKAFPADEDLFYFGTKGRKLTNHPEVIKNAINKIKRERKCTYTVNLSVQIKPYYLDEEGNFRFKYRNQTEPITKNSETVVKKPTPSQQLAKLNSLTFNKSKDDVVEFLQKYEDLSNFLDEINVKLNFIKFFEISKRTELEPRLPELTFLNLKEEFYSIYQNSNKNERERLKLLKIEDCKDLGEFIDQKVTYYKTYFRLGNFSIYSFIVNEHFNSLMSVLENSKHVLIKSSKETFKLWLEMQLKHQQRIQLDDNGDDDNGDDDGGGDDGGGDDGGGNLREDQSIPIQPNANGNAGNGGNLREDQTIQLDVNGSAGNSGNLREDQTIQLDANGSAGNNDNLRNIDENMNEEDSEDEILFVEYPKKSS